MATSWDVVNPDNRVDVLPQPYRAINKIVEDILREVGDQVREVDTRRKSEEYEYGLPEVRPSKVVALTGSVTCAHVEPRRTSRLAFGTSLGEVCIVDTKTQDIIAQKHALPENEAVFGVALSSDGKYGPRPTPLDQQDAPAPTPPAQKLFIVGRSTPRIFGFSVVKNAFGGFDLSASCCVHVPPLPAPSATEEDDVPPPPVVEQLHVRGATDGIWVLALMYDRTIRVYLCPLGPPLEDGGNFASADAQVMGQVILEDEPEGDEGDGPSDEFSRTPQIETPIYSFALHSMAPLPGLPEPGLDTLSLSVFSLTPSTSSLATGTSARHVPLTCMASSTESVVLLCYSCDAPPPLAAAPNTEVDALLKMRLPPLGGLEPAKESKPLAPRRRWVLPSMTTATAVSPDGRHFAAGGSSGTLAVVDASLGPSLVAMLPGHYSAVTALSFHRSIVLVSACDDGWIQHYNLSTRQLTARFLCAPPPAPGPVKGLVSAQALPLAVSFAQGGKELRLLDLRHNQKLAKLKCYEETEEEVDGDKNGSIPKGANGMNTTPQGPLGGAAASAAVAESPGVVSVEVDEMPRLVMVSTTAFVVVCEADLEGDVGLSPGPSKEATDGTAEKGPDASEEEEAHTENSVDEQRSCLAFFDFGKTLKALYPGLSAKAEKGGTALAEAFATLGSDTKDGARTGMSPSDRLTHLEAPAILQGLGGSTLPSSPLSKAATKLPMQTVVKLTAENLKRMDSAADPSAVTADPGGLGHSEKTPQNDLVERTLQSKQGPENWQVSVRRCLRNSLAQKEPRLRRIQKRVDQLRKELAET
mmetsp:Transcript_1847/g.3854  ORF Transcript_1847/g.3854 Transcript_1847/m.3854 type:complete len:811 (+) Transcript_1847:117-2549(+)